MREIPLPEAIGGEETGFFARVDRALDIALNTLP